MTDIFPSSIEPQFFIQLSNSNKPLSLIKFIDYLDLSKLIYSGSTYLFNTNKDF